MSGFIKTFRLIVVLILAAGPSAAGPGVLTVLAFGDSLTAGYGLGPGQSVPAQLEDALHDRGIAAHVVNAGVSGDTTTGGRARLQWALSGLNDGAPDLVILALGANDALRGIDPKLTRANLAAMIETLQARKIPVLLIGMVAPPNMGPDYGAAFNPIYPELAKKYHVPLYPFFLDGVAAKPALNQDDGMHPNAAGVAVIVKRLAPVVAKLLSGKSR